MGMSIPAVVGLVCAVVGLIFQIVGLATPGWASAVGFSTGLWEYCVDAMDTCIKLPSISITDEVQAIRAFGILGLLVLAGCVVVAVLLFVVKKDVFKIIAGILGIVAALCILIEFAIFVDYKAANADQASGLVGVDYGYSFALTIVAFVLALVAGILFLVAKFMGGDS